MELNCGVDVWKSTLLDRLTSADIVVERPEPLAKDDYDRALQALVDAVIDHPSVVAVYGDSVTPVAPGISDLDTAIVVEDEPSGLDDLGRSVERVMNRHDRVFVHGPVLVPESAFEYLSLFANLTTYLDHVAGKRLSTVDAGETAMALRFFDRLSFNPCYTSIASCLVPQLTLATNLTTEVPLASNAVRLLEPIEAIELDILSESHRCLHLDMRKGLRKATTLRHRWNKYEASFGESPPCDEAILDRIGRARQEYFERGLSESAYLELLLDTLVATHSLSVSFIDRQSIYPSLDRPFVLRRDCPAVAVPNWRSLPPQRLLERFVDANIPGHVVPTQVVAHLSKQPWGTELFHDRSPTVSIENPAVRSLISRRNEGIRRYLEFVEANEFDDDVFLMNSLVTSLYRGATVATGSVSKIETIKQWLVDVRNGVVAHSWCHSFGEPSRSYADGSITGRSVHDAQ